MYKNIVLKTFFALIFLCQLSYAGPQIQDQFQVDMQAQNEGVMLTWQIADQAFIYKDRIHWTTSPKLHLKPQQWPGASLHRDKLGQTHEVYFHQLKLFLPYPKNLKTQSFNLVLKYQGCSLKGVCFPPKTQSFQVQKTSQHLLLEILSFLGLGILLAFTPCVLPMLPIMTKIVIGNQTQKTGQTFALSLAYVFGMATTYAAVGALIASLGKNLFILMQQTWISVLMAVIFIGLGIATLGFFEIQLPQSLQQKTLGFRSSLKSGRYISAFIMGSISLLVLSPCVTAPLLAALTYITQLGQVWRGSLALFCLGLGMGLPLMIFAVSAGHYLPRAGTWMEQVKKVLALLLFAVAALLLNRSLSSPWNLAIWPGFGLITLILLKPMKEDGFKLKILKSSFILGLFVFIGCQSLHPHQEHAQTLIQDQGRLKQVLAQHPKHPVLLYFSAKWCSTCKYLEQKVWSNQALQPLLAEADLIKVDLSSHNQAQEEMMQAYEIIAPPTVILIDPNHPKQHCRLLGEEITVSKLKHWQTIIHQNQQLSSCD